MTGHTSQGQLRYFSCYLISRSVKILRAFQVLKPYKLCQLYTVCHNISLHLTQSECSQLWPEKWGLWNSTYTVPLEEPLPWKGLLWEIKGSSFQPSTKLWLWATINSQQSLLSWPDVLQDHKWRSDHPSISLFLKAKHQGLFLRAKSECIR